MKERETKSERGRQRKVRTRPGSENIITLSHCIQSNTRELCIPKGKKTNRYYFYETQGERERNKKKCLEKVFFLLRYDLRAEKKSLLRYKMDTLLIHWKTKVQSEQEKKMEK